MLSGCRDEEVEKKRSQQPARKQPENSGKRNLPSETGEQVRLQPFAES